MRHGQPRQASFAAAAIVQHFVPSAGGRCVRRLSTSSCHASSWPCPEGSRYRTPSRGARSDRKLVGGPGRSRVRVPQEHRRGALPEHPLGRRRRAAATAPYRCRPRRLGLIAPVPARGSCRLGRMEGSSSATEASRSRRGSRSRANHENENSPIARLPAGQAHAPTMPRRPVPLVDGRAPTPARFRPVKLRVLFPVLPGRRPDRSAPMRARCRLRDRCRKSTS